MTSTKPHIPDYMQGKLSVPKFSNLPQNLEYLLNTYQFSCKYLLKTYLLKRKKPTFTRISESKISRVLLQWELRGCY